MVILDEGDYFLRFLFFNWFNNNNLNMFILFYLYIFDSINKMILIFICI